MGPSFDQSEYPTSWLGGRDRRPERDKSPVVWVLSTDIQMPREMKAFSPGVAKLRLCAFGTVSTYLPWQHGGNPSRAGKNKINTRRGAVVALSASSKTLGPAVHDATCPRATQPASS